MEQAHPDDDRKSMNATERTKTKPELRLFPLPDEATEMESMDMPEGEWPARRRIDFH